MPPTVRIEIIGLKEIRARFAQVPEKFNEAVLKTLETVLFILSESVPPYPDEPEGSTYDRTGTLGRRLGSSETGSATGMGASISEARPLGSSAGWQADWGTSLSYAPYVIGTWQQAGHMRHWWTIADVARRASPKIAAAFDNMAEVLARWLDGRE